MFKIDEEYFDSIEDLEEYTDGHIKGKEVGSGSYASVFATGDPNVVCKITYLPDMAYFNFVKTLSELDAIPEYLPKIYHVIHLRLKPDSPDFYSCPSDMHPTTSAGSANGFGVSERLVVYMERLHDHFRWQNFDGERILASAATRAFITRIRDECYGSYDCCKSRQLKEEKRKAIKAVVEARDKMTESWFDLHAGNIMVRKVGNLRRFVIVDPIAG